MKSLDLQRFMNANGFYLVRQRRHLIWSDGKRTITTSSTPRCPHVIDRIRQQLTAFKKQEGAL